MVPLVGSVRELQLVRDETERIIADVEAETGVTLQVPIGTMIELPRAALTAFRVAEAADFFSFGTNDLTQTTWGFSRDDVEARAVRALPGHRRVHRVAVRDHRRRRRRAGSSSWPRPRAGGPSPDLKLGVCGEHGGDPESIHFFHRVGLDYVSCSPFRVPVARLEAGRATVLAG